MGHYGTVAAGLAETLCMLAETRYGVPRSELFLSSLVITIVDRPPWRSTSTVEPTALASRRHHGELVRCRCDSMRWTYELDHAQGPFLVVDIADACDGQGACVAAP